MSTQFKKIEFPAHNGFCYDHGYTGAAAIVRAINLVMSGFGPQEIFVADHHIYGDEIRACVTLELCNDSDTIYKLRYSDGGPSAAIASNNHQERIAMVSMLMMGHKMRATNEGHDVRIFVRP